MPPFGALLKDFRTQSSGLFPQLSDALGIKLLRGVAHFSFEFLDDFHRLLRIVRHDFFNRIHQRLFATEIGIDLRLITDQVLMAFTTRSSVHLPDRCPGLESGHIICLRRLLCYGLHTPFESLILHVRRYMV